MPGLYNVVVSEAVPADGHHQALVSDQSPIPTAAATDSKVGRASLLPSLVQINLSMVVFVILDFLSL